MKKFKVTFGFSNLFKATSKEVATLQIYVKTVTITLVSVFYYAEEKYAVYMAITGFVMDSLFHFMSIDRIENKETDVSTKSEV